MATALNTFTVGDEVRVKIFKDTFSCRGTIAYINDNGTYEILFENSKRAKSRRKLSKYRYKYTHPVTRIVSYYPQQEGVFAQTDLSPLSVAEKLEAALVVTKTDSKSALSGAEIVAAIQKYKGLGNELFLANDLIGAMDYYERGLEFIQLLGGGNSSSAAVGASQSTEAVFNGQTEFSVGSSVIVRQRVSNTTSSDFEYRNGMISDIIVDNKTKSSAVSYEILLSPIRIGLGGNGKEDCDYAYHSDEDNDGDYGANNTSETDEEETIIICGDDPEALSMGLYKIVTETNIHKYDAALELSNSSSNSSRSSTIDVFSGNGEKSTLSASLLSRSSSNKDSELVNLQRAYALNMAKCLWKLNGYVGWACHYASLAVCMTLFKYEEVSDAELYGGDGDGAHAGTVNDDIRYLDANSNPLYKEYEKQLVDVYYIKAKTLLSGQRAGLAKKEVSRMRQLFIPGSFGSRKVGNAGSSSSARNTTHTAAGSYSAQKIAQLEAEIDQFNNRKKRENKSLAKHIASWVGTAMDINAQVQQQQQQQQQVGEGENTQQQQQQLLQEQEATDDAELNEDDDEIRWC